MYSRVLLTSVLLSFALPSIAATSLRYEGSSTIGKIMTDVAGSYPAVQLTVDTVPESAGGEQCALRKTCDIGGVARTVGERFVTEGVVPTLIAKDAIAVLVHQDNPVKSLSLEQLKGIFAGEITRWSAVGGADVEIKVYVVKEASATRQVFAKAVLGDVAYGKVEVVTPDARMIPAVAKDPAAIGQLSFAFLPEATGVKPLDIGAQVASVENPDYPISRPLYLTTHGAPTGEVKKFIDWLLSPEGQSIIKKRFVGVSN